MQFRTNFTVPPFPFKITHENCLFSIGSCFSTLMGEKLLQRKFDVLNNPFGTIFNPVSLFTLLHQSLSRSQLDHSLVLEAQQKFFHYGVHSSISGNQKEQLLEKMESIQSHTREYLSKASHIFITFGTAYVYELKKNGKPVANCHKQPNSLFNKRLLLMEEMKESFGIYYALQKQENDNCQIILTVSPVRHIKDGIPENQLSKSLLRVLTHQLQEEHEDVSYFPSYELMMDDLRDYRFYKEDMIHPTKQAETYIWELFKDCYFDKDTARTVKSIESIRTSLAHRPIHADSSSHQHFLRNLLQMMERMQPEFDFSMEIDEVKSKIKTNF